MLKKLWSSTGTGVALRAPFPAGRGQLPELLLLLRIHADHRRTGGLMGLDLLVDVGELRIAVGMLPALQRLGRALQTEAVLPQQPAHRRRRHRMALLGQLGRQMTQRLRRPPQRRHRIPAGVRLDQPQQGRHQLRVMRGDRPTPSAGSPGPPDRQRLLRGIQLGHPAAHRGRADPGRLRDRGHAPVPQQPGLAGQRQPLLPLVQMR
jgi:hypothetical protein